MGSDEVDLKGGKIVLFDSLAGEGAEPCVDAIVGEPIIEDRLKADSTRIDGLGRFW